MRRKVSELKGAEKFLVMFFSLASFWLFVNALIFLFYADWARALSCLFGYMICALYVYGISVEERR